MRLDKERLEKYLDELAAESTDLQSILGRSDDEILQDRHIIKSLKYSTIVIAEAMASTLQHILAKRHNVVIDGYMEVFTKSKEYQLVPDEVLSRLRPFIRFRNMLVHQYWRVNNQIFLKNLRDGLQDFRFFVKGIREIIREASLENSTSSTTP